MLTKPYSYSLSYSLSEQSLIVILILIVINLVIVLYSLTRATLMSPGKDETRACGYIYIYIYIFQFSLKLIVSNFCFNFKGCHVWKVLVVKIKKLEMFFFSKKIKIWN